MSRIVDKIEARRKKNRNRCARRGDHKEDADAVPLYYSFEFFPPKTEAGLDNLLLRIDRMTRRLDPLFIDVTWGAGGSTAARSLAVASHAQRYSGVDVLLHLTCTGMTREKLKNALHQAKTNGIRNILALRGDPPRGKRSWEVDDISGGDCNRAIDLVRLIRELHGDYFGIAIAGHPEGHPSSSSREDEMQHLKEKLDAGADLILTQFFYSSFEFLHFVRTCREMGINCPILPGIMPIQSYSSFTRMTRYCNISVPSDIMGRIEAVKGDDEAVKEIGCEIAVDMCHEILKASQEEGGVDGIHFYTLNLERSVTRILIKMGAVDLLIPTAPPGGNVPDSNGKTQPPPSPSTMSVDVMRSLTGRQLPWRPSALEKRSREEVRPINWANRPNSYVMRTDDWDEFPNGRWGDATSPAFGELSEMSHFYNFTLGNDDDRRAILGFNPKTQEDVFEVFARYIEGEVSQIPWCETPLQPESFFIQKQLAGLNRAGFLTINSQPAVNGVVSSDPTFGWGGSGGFVYQKAYCECFASPEHTNRLVEALGEYPNLNLYAVNNAGVEIRAGIDEDGVTALTWGVFPNREILQPTIFDPTTFLVWAEEAFSLWTTMWSSLYDFDSESYDLIEGMRDTFYLVAIIDNDFTEPEGSQIWSSMISSIRIGNGTSS